MLRLWLITPACVALLTSSLAGAASSPAQLLSNNSLQIEALKYQTGSETPSLNVPRVTTFIYDVATDLGTATTHGLGVYLPAKTVIIRSWFKIITQFSDSGSGTVALKCEDANNIKTATDLTGLAANSINEGASTGSAATMVRGIAAQCEITATVATAAQLTGKLLGWILWTTED